MVRSASVKECKASHESWATRLFVHPIGHPANGPAVPLHYNELVGIFSEATRLVLTTLRQTRAQIWQASP